MSFKKYNPIISLLFPIIFSIGALIILHVDKNQENIIIFLVVYMVWFVAVGILVIWHIGTMKYVKRI